MTENYMSALCSEKAVRPKQGRSFGYFFGCMKFRTCQNLLDHISISIPVYIILFLIDFIDHFIETVKINVKTKI